MTDNITLRRAFVKKMRELIRIAVYSPYGSEFRDPYKHQQAALAALDAALAEPPAKPEPVAWMVTTTDERHFIFRMVKPVVSEGETLTPLFTHPPATVAEPPAKPEPVAWVLSDCEGISFNSA